MSRSTIKYLILLAVAVLLFYWKTLLTNQFTAILGVEGVNLTYGWLHFWVHSVRQGHVPLWDPYAFGGRPFSGEILTSTFFPFQLIFALFPFTRDGLISPRLYHVVLALTHLLGTYFMFALLRELRCSRLAAFVGACAFSMGGLIVRMMWPPYIESCVWLPAIFFFLLRALRAGSRERALLEAAISGLCFGMSILIGGMHFCMMQGIFVVTAVLFYGACGPFEDVDANPSRSVEHRRAHWKRSGMILAVFLVVAGAAGAVQLLPAYQYSKLTERFIDGGIYPSSKKIPYHRMNPGMWPQSIVTGLIPTAFGGRFGGGEIWPYYVGALPFFLAIGAIWRRWRNLWVRYLTGLAIAAFAYSLGEFSALNGVLYAVVPFLWAARSPSRFLYLVSFSLAVLAAFGLDTLTDRNILESSWAPAERILKWVAIVCAASLFVPGVFEQITIGIWNALSLLLILGACGCFAYLIHHPAGPWVRVLVAMFVLFDLQSFSWLERDKSESSKPAGQLEQMITLGPVAKFIKAQPGLYRTRIGVSPEPNFGDVYSVQTIWGGTATLLTELSHMGLRADLLNIRYVVKPASTSDPGAVYQDAHWKVYLNPNAYPRAWIVHHSRREPSQDAIFQHLDDPGVNLHQTAFIEKPLPESLDPNPDGGDTVQFRSYAADRLEMEVDSGSEGLLVLSEMYYPGWHATLNGKPVKILQVDGAFRGIMVPRGRNRIEMQFLPLTTYGGGVLSLLAFLGVSVGVFVAWRRGVWRISDPAADLKPDAARIS
ncbi:MAG TPA: YfhO family protein [Bryobacteraceae bacterium]|jgi:hypothetical protein|nr:YfhO family protein [Bryobacteraceae bacterium]